MRNIAPCADLPIFLTQNSTVGELFGLQLVSGVNKELIQDFLLSLLRPADTSSIANIPTQISSTLLIGLVREASSELYEFVAALADVFVTGIIASHDPRALGLRNSLSQMFVPSLYSWLREMRPEGFSELLSVRFLARCCSVSNICNTVHLEIVGYACISMESSRG